MKKAAPNPQQKDWTMTYVAIGLVVCLVGGLAWYFIAGSHESRHESRIVQATTEQPQTARILHVVHIVSATGPDSDAIVDQLLGEWETQSTFMGGQSMFMPNPARVHVFLIHGGTYTPEDDDDVIGTQEWSIDTSATPIAVDVSSNSSRKSDTPRPPSPGILDLSGEQLRICRGIAERPKDFTVATEPSYNLMTFRRMR